MSASTLARSFVLLTLAAAAPGLAAEDCNHALAKASAKFVGAAFKSAQRCVALRGAGKLPAASCQLSSETTGDKRTDAALAHAETHLRQGLAPCSDAVLSHMGFDGACPNGSAGAFGRGDVQECIATTHMRAVQALVAVEFPQQASNCGNGVVDPEEDCDPVANPTECATGETCVPAGSADECTCIEAGSSSCGNGTVDAGEACDPAAVPTGCPSGMTCGTDCTCSNGSGSQCQGTCTPTCSAGQSCHCSCTSGTCGNGTRDAGEQCDPMANPSGCATGMVCGAPGTAQQCTCFTQSGTCGNGMLDPGESCDPALPNTCDPGEVCLSSGAMACTCGAPPSNCGNGMIEWGEQCDPSANPTGCPTGQTCGARDTAGACTCSGGGGGGGMCGNGTVDAGEQCDPAANPTGCAAQQTCSGQCTCSGGGGGTCGNGVLDAGEQCDPTANPPGCPAGVTCSSTCTCGSGGGGGGPCACGATTPSRLSFTTSVGSGNCGSVMSGTGTVSKNLQCGGLFTGAGSNTVPLPYAVPDMGTSLTKVSACSGTNVTLVNLTSADTGSDRNCTSVGCLFGPPLPIPNAGSPPTSVCVVNKVATDASGSADCTTGESNLNLPLTSTLYLTGDMLPAVPGVQPCPICSNGTCQGGPNDGHPCTPGSSAINEAFPTSHDCPPPESANIGGLPIAFNLTTSTQTKTATNNTTSGQNNVFCGFCRDINAAGTGCFAGDPGPSCPAGGSTFQSCTSNTDCSGSFPDCEQRDPGAFGPAGGGARTITETGSPAGNMTDGAPHASTLVSIFCIPPTFNPTVDAAGDLPGPGAVSLSGMAQLLP